MPIALVFCCLFVPFFSNDLSHIGNGFSECERSCLEPCLHGTCSGTGLSKVEERVQPGWNSSIERSGESIGVKK